MLDQIINKFCGYGRRYETPSTIGDYVYATNGHILLKAHKSHFKKEYETNSFMPDCEAVLMKSKGELFSLSPALILERYEAMPKDPIYEDCEKCEGSGEYDCECCGYCNPCEDCNGEGNSGNVIGHQVNAEKHAFSISYNGAFAPEYMKTIAELAQLVKTDSIKVIASEASKLQFQVNYVQVLLMGLDIDHYASREMKLNTFPIIQPKSA